MDYVITGMHNGKFTVTDNDERLASVLEDLYKNNTAFPDIIDLYEYKKEVKVEKTDGNGNTYKEKVFKDALRVRFADGSWTDVVKSDDDAYDRVTAILYAIVKRLFGTPTEGGYVCGDGFMGYLKRLTKSVRTDETEAAKRAKQMKDKEEADKKAHEEAVKRREKNPSLGIRLNNLEKNLNSLCENLNKYFSKNLK